jgi:hypothetical protein
VGVGETPTGPLTVHGQTRDLAEATYVLNDLVPGQTVYVAVRAYTPAHGYQRNALSSPHTGAVVVTLSYGQLPLILKRSA